MKKIKNLKSVLFRTFVVVLVIVMIVFLPTVKLKQNQDLENIYGVFLGNKSKYQGILEIWNIDSFEGGNKSKTSLLNEITKEYQKTNKGVYFMVRNLTENESLSLAKNGEIPDLISCSYGVAEKLKSYIQRYSNFDDSNFENGAKTLMNSNDAAVAIPWCKGAYFLISTRDKLERAKVENTDKVKLSSIVFSSGYVVNGKKNDRIVYSLAAGGYKYLMPQTAFKTYTNREVDLVSKYSCGENLNNKTPYTAYCEFVADNSVILLGTQRDFFRMKNREVCGKVSDLIVEQVFGFTDLIQFMMLGKNLSGEKRTVAEDFVKFLTGEKAQNIILKSGLFSVINLASNDDKMGTMQNIIPQNFSDYVAPKVFISENEIKALQKF